MGGGGEQRFILEDRPARDAADKRVGGDWRSKGQTAGDLKLHLNESKQMLDAVGVREKQGKTNLKGIFHDKAEFTHFAGLTWNATDGIWEK